MFKNSKKRLQKIYETAPLAEDAFSFQEFEGFMLGVILSPEFIPPSSWLPISLGETQPEFNSEKEESDFFEAVFGRYNDLSDDRSNGKLLLPSKAKKTTHSQFDQWTEWASGFCAALELKPDVWGIDNDKKIKGNSDIPLREALELIFMLGRIESLALQMDAELTANEQIEFAEELVAALPPALAVVLDYADQYDKSTGTEATPEHKPTIKIGRNDPCICGSGKKYKKCCLLKKNDPDTQLPKGNVIPFPAAKKDVDVPVLSNSQHKRFLDIIQERVDAVKKGRGLKLNDRDLNFLYKEPAVLFGLVRFIVDEANKGENVNEDIMYAVQGLFVLLLENLRASIEREIIESVDTLKILQLYINQLAIEPDCCENLCLMMASCLKEARLPIDPILKETYDKMLNAIISEGDVASTDINDDKVLTILKENDIDDPYEAFSFLMEMLQLFDVEIVVVLVQNWATSEVVLFREIAPLFILHQEKEVRTRVASILVDSVQSFSPETLRRLILMRNWVDDDMQKNLDLCIKKARKARIECATSIIDDTTEFFATPVDGNGAQVIWFQRPLNKGYYLDCILWKQSEGIFDAWGTECTKSEAKSLLRQTKQGVGLAKVERDYVDLIVCHALSVGRSLGNVPALMLLSITERLGMKDWKPLALDIDSTIDVLYVEADKLKKSVFTSKAQLKILRESYSWIESKQFAKSWFEDHAEIFEILEDKIGSRSSWSQHEGEAIALILDEFLEGKKEVWIERLVIMTLWFKAHTGRAPLGWHKMLCVARNLSGAEDIKGSPLMVAVAEDTLSAAYERGE